LQSALHNRCGLRILAVEQVSIFVEQADLRTQPLKGLRQLATNRSATDDCKAWRTLSKTEYCFTGQIADLSQSRDRRLRGARAGRDDRPFESQGLSCDLNRIGTGKAGVTQENIHTKLCEALC